MRGWGKKTKVSFGVLTGKFVLVCLFDGWLVCFLFVCLLIRSFFCLSVGSSVCLLAGWCMFLPPQPFFCSIRTPVLHSSCGSDNGLWIARSPCSHCALDDGMDIPSMAGAVARYLQWSPTLEAHGCSGPHHLAAGGANLFSRAGAQWTFWHELTPLPQRVPWEHPLPEGHAFRAVPARVGDYGGITSGPPRPRLPWRPGNGGMVFTEFYL